LTYNLNVFNFIFERRSRRPRWCIGCIFITVGLLALFGMIAALAIVFGS